MLLESTRRIFCGRLSRVQRVRLGSVPTVIVLCIRSKLLNINRRSPPNQNITRGKCLQFYVHKKHRQFILIADYNGRSKVSGNIEHRFWRCRKTTGPRISQEKGICDRDVCDSCRPLMTNMTGNVFLKSRSQNRKRFTFPNFEAYPACTCWGLVEQ